MAELKASAPLANGWDLLQGLNKPVAPAATTPAPVTPPTTNPAVNPIPATALQQKQTPLVPPLPTPQPTQVPDFSSMIADAEKLYQQSAEEKALMQRQSSMLEQLGQLPNASQMYSQARDQYGLDAKQKAADEAFATLKQKQAEWMAVQPQIEGQYSQTDALQGFLDQRTQGIRNRMAPDMYMAQAMYEAASGSFDRAQQSVDKAVELQFQDRQQYIDTAKMQLDFLGQAVERGEVRRTKAIDTAIAERNRLLEQQQREIDIQREEKKGIQNIALKLASFGISPSIVAKAKTVDEAIQLAGKNLQDPKDALELQRLDQEIQLNKLKREAQIAENNAITSAQAGDISSLMATNKIGQGTKTAIGTILGVQNALETFAANNSNGKFAGINPANSLLDAKVPLLGFGFPFRETLKQQKGTENAGYIDGINLKVQQWASGAALTEAQTEQVARMTPTRTDTDAQAKTKTNNLANFMQDQIKGALQAEGVTWNPPKIDLFNSADNLDKIMSL